MRCTTMRCHRKNDLCAKYLAREFCSGDPTVGYRSFGHLVHTASSCTPFYIQNRRKSRTLNFPSNASNVAISLKISTYTNIILKGVPEAIEHRAWTQVVHGGNGHLRLRDGCSALDFAVHSRCTANPPGVIMVHFQDAPNLGGECPEPYFAQGQYKESHS